MATSPSDPRPSPQELAAIVAAVELAWPRPVTTSVADPAMDGDAWRWSGRWWGRRHLVADRRRPW